VRTSVGSLIYDGSALGPCRKSRLDSLPHLPSMGALQSLVAPWHSAVSPDHTLVLLWIWQTWSHQHPKQLADWASLQPANFTSVTLLVMLLKLFTGTLQMIVQDPESVSSTTTRLVALAVLLLAEVLKTTSGRILLADNFCFGTCGTWTAALGGGCTHLVGLQSLCRSN